MYINSTNLWEATYIKALDEKLMIDDHISVEYYINSGSPTVYVYIDGEIVYSRYFDEDHYYYKIPNSAIIKINDWSKGVVNEKKERELAEKQHKEQHFKALYPDEESPTLLKKLKSLSSIDKRFVVISFVLCAIFLLISVFMILSGEFMALIIAIMVLYVIKTTINYINTCYSLIKGGYYED